MKAIADDLRKTVKEALPLLVELDEEVSARPLAPGKWCPREVLGHLIDSASNNHQRFVRACFREDLVFDGYDQDAWVRFQRYREASWRELVELWRSFNLHLSWIIEGISPETALRARSRHNLDQIAWRTVSSEEPVTLEYFLRDYIDHVRHHLASLSRAVR